MSATTDSARWLAQRARAIAAEAERIAKDETATTERLALAATSLVMWSNATLGTALRVKDADQVELPLKR